MSHKRDLVREYAACIASDLAEKTDDLYRKYELTGSIRRKESIVRDIDFAVIPSGNDHEKVEG